jgi:xylan 1,4-beta-xylosidase
VIKNPILSGFNPDPSICRVGADFYIATSTFEWFPGVQIHYSRDLINWQLICRPLERISQLNMFGNPASGGIWAPCLSYSDGLFWLVYSDVKNLHSSYKDVHNYLVTSSSITGPWSEPIYLNSSGFDPSLFHDTNGKKYLVNMVWDHRKWQNHFNGIIIQEYVPKEGKLVGKAINIFKGTNLGCTEGPHIYSWDGWYYLITAEGGTGYSHAVTVCRSRSLYGSWEVDPLNPMLTSSKHDNTLPLQKAGHASLVDTSNGQWYLAHLASRPIKPMMRSILGRETALQEVEWSKDGWLRLKNGCNAPQLEIKSPGLTPYLFPKEPERFDFDSQMVPICFQSLRRPIDESWLSLSSRAGYLRLYGGESPDSLFRQSFIARRIDSLPCTVQTSVDFEPVSFQQMAGLIAWYSSDSHYYLRISHDETVGKSLNIIAANDKGSGEILRSEVPLPPGTVHLRFSIDEHGTLRFYYSCNEVDYLPIGGVLDGTVLSDEYINHGRFTGAFCGICCQDLSGTRMPADFDYFEYNTLQQL